MIIKAPQSLASTFFIILLMLGLSACDTSTTNDNEADEAATEAVIPPKVVAWLALTDAEQTPSRLLSGQVIAAESTPLSFESSGQIQTLAINIGEAFKSGQTLATLVPTNYQLQIKKAQAQFDSAVATRDRARKEVRRYERLVKSAAVSKSQLDHLRLQLKSAQENINAGKAQLDLAKKQLDDTQLIAPFDGVVTRKLAEVGQLTGPSSPVLVVEAAKPPEVVIGVPENLIQNLSIGQTVRVNFPALTPPLALSGTVAEISIQASLGSFPVKITLDAPSKNVKSGMTAEVLLQQPTDQVTNAGRYFYIPPHSLGAGENDKHFVYRIADKHDDLLLERVPVTVAGLGGETLQISGDLHVGDKLVRSGLGFLHDGQSVILMGEGAKRINP
ncbi:MAG: hypothetical protein CSA47_01740 [Gammaproteobacteria bacterium]|nr:MAG: hypothetical protein CSA47_01740 [Gammaproteobacteria bacterium]